MRSGPAIALLLLAALLAAGAMPHAVAQQVRVQPRIEKTEVYVGESFVFEIHVENDDSPAAPGLSHLENFSVEFLGERKNNSQSMTIVNGRVSREVKRGYIFQYRLTAKRAGALTIPRIEVQAGGQRFRTNPIRVNASRPKETQDFKLRIGLSKARCYVGEPVVLTATWYLAQNVRDVEFSVPVLEDKRFFVDDVEFRQDPRKEYFRLRVGSEEVIAEKGTGTLDGQNYTTLTFKKALVPRAAGNYTLPEATVSCQALVSGSRQRRTSPMDSFFSDSFFNFGTRGQYSTFVIPSKPLQLEVVPLPEQGRPRGFSGLVGQYRIEAEATPADVSVGDPITLAIRISGNAYLKHVELPPLEQQPELASRFKMPHEMAEARMEGGAKVYTQTIRALNDTVTDIPPIKLSFFDTKKGAYRSAQSKAIPLNVKTTKVVTAQDAEGRELSAARNQLTVWREGIAHNYTDLSVIEQQAYGPAAWLRSPLWLGVTALPLLAYCVLLAVLLTRRRQLANPGQRRARRAYGELAAALAKTEGEADARAWLLEALRGYLGAKLRTPPGALTYDDAANRLGQMGVSEGSLGELKSLFDECEAYRYAGGAGSQGGAHALVERAAALGKAIEKEMGR